MTSIAATLAALAERVQHELGTARTLALPLTTARLALRAGLPDTLARGIYEAMQALDRLGCAADARRRAALRLAQAWEIHPAQITLGSVRMRAPASWEPVFADHHVRFVRVAEILAAHDAPPIPGTGQAAASLATFAGPLPDDHDPDDFALPEAVDDHQLLALADAWLERALPASISAFFRPFPAGTSATTSEEA